MRLYALALTLLVACGSTQPPPAGQEPAVFTDEPAGTLAAPVVAEKEPPPPPETPIADQYREVAAKIIAAAEKDEGGWKKLAHLTDRIGHRISGSAALDRAIAWAITALKADRLDNVHGEKVMVPKWVRGEEWGRLTAPVDAHVSWASPVPEF